MLFVHMKTIRRFGNLANAGFAKSLLESVGIQAALPDEFTFSWGSQYVPWGIRLQVPDADAERAICFLDRQEGFEPLPDDFNPPPEIPVGPIDPVQRRQSAIGAFVVGGNWAFGIFAAFAIVAHVFGGEAHADLGGLVCLFIFGGLIGLTVRVIYNKGRRDAAS